MMIDPRLIFADGCIVFVDLFILYWVLPVCWRPHPRGDRTFYRGVHGNVPVFSAAITSHLATLVYLNYHLVKGTYSEEVATVTFCGLLITVLFTLLTCRLALSNRMGWWSPGWVKELRRRGEL